MCTADGLWLDFEVNPGNVVPGAELGRLLEEALWVSALVASEPRADSVVDLPQVAGTFRLGLHSLMAHGARVLVTSMLVSDVLIVGSLFRRK